MKPVPIILFLGTRYKQDCKVSEKKKPEVEKSFNYFFVRIEMITV